VDVDGTIEGFEIPIGDFEEKVLTGTDAATGTGQREEEVELLAGERERLVVERDGVRARVDIKVTDDDGRITAVGSLRFGEEGAAEDGAQACEEFASGEGFGQVIVGSHFEADDAVVLFAATGEHEHGDLGVGAKSAQNLEAIEAGKHHVEDDGVVTILQSAGQAGGAGVFHRDVIAHRLEIFLHEAAKAYIVFDQQKASEGRGFRGHGFL